jgi:5-oxoprolinase (ATP-hydrolysing) subunit A
MRIDLNCDLGESFGPWKMGADEAVMASITSANVACGFHAGDPSVMRRTIQMARAHGVAVGAHPGFQDLVGFGRRDVAASPDEVEDLVLYQVAAIAGVAGAEGVRLQHVKAHGALYNMAARNRPLADAIARATAAFDKSLILFGLPNSALLDAGRAAGLRVVAEAFADRSYEHDGSLTSRRQPNAIVHDPAVVVERVLRMAKDGSVVASDGSTVNLNAETVCVHGDTPGAADLVARIRDGLARAGVEVRPIGQ